VTVRARGSAHSASFVRYLGFIAVVAASVLPQGGNAQAPAVAYVQSNSTKSQTPQSVVTLAFTAAQTAGNLNVVVVGWYDSTAHAQSISDAAGNA
jgi:hypothetical protein